MTDFEILLKSITIYDYKFILELMIPKESNTTPFKLLKKDQLISDSISLYYSKSDSNNKLLFYSVFSRQLLSARYDFLSPSSNGFLYSLAGNNMTLEKIIHNVYYKIEIPAFPILLKETTRF